MEDITLRALRILGQVPIIAAEDTRSARHLLTHHLIGAGGEHPAPRIFSFFAGNEAARTAQLLAALRGGEDVALISEAGLPGVSDPGQRLVAAARAAEIAVEVVPGPCAAVTALVGSGLPTDRFLFVGFLPRRSGPRQALLAGLATEPGTLIFYEAPDRVPATLVDLASAFGAARQACLARELTKLFEEYAIATLGELAARHAGAPPRGEVTIVVSGWNGDVLPASSGISDSAKNVEDEVRERLRAGEGPREIAAALAKKSGHPRRKLYQLAIALSKSADA